MTDERTEPLTPDDAAPGEDVEGADPATDVQALQAALQEVTEKYLRARADYQNLQRRAQEERHEFGRYQLISMVLNMLPVLDDLQRALEAAPDASADDAWVEGVRLVEQKFRAVLEAAGVTEIGAADQPFDPERHEAVGSAPGPEGRVVHVVQRGYALQDRVVRAAMVLVGNGESAQTDGPTEQQNEPAGTDTAV